MRSSGVSGGDVGSRKRREYQVFGLAAFFVPPRERAGRGGGGWTAGAIIKTL